MHGNAGIDIFGNGWNGLGWALPCCDQAVSALLEDLDQRGLLDARWWSWSASSAAPPHQRGAAAIGRDHWPNCYSAMLAGRGSAAGRSTAAPTSRRLTSWTGPSPPKTSRPPCFHALDIPPETPIHPDGFSVRASAGQAILSLF